MPIARFQMPDGRIARFEVPEGTTPEQAHTAISASLAPKSQENDSFLGQMGANFRHGIQSAKDLLSGNYQDINRTVHSPKTEALGDKLFPPGSDGSIMDAVRHVGDRTSFSDWSGALLEKFGETPEGKALSTIMGVNPVYNAAGTAFSRYVNPAIEEATGIHPDNLALAETVLPIAGVKKAATVRDPASVAAKYASGKISDGAGKVVDAITPSIEDGMRPVVALAQKYNIPVSLSQVTSSNALKAAQRVSKDLPFSGEGAFRENQMRAFNRELIKTVGGNANKFTPELMDALFTKIGREFDDFGKGKSFNLDEDFMVSTKKLLDEAEPLTSDGKSRLKAGISRIYKEADENGIISGEKLGKLRSDLNRDARKAAKIKNYEAQEVFHDLENLVVDIMKAGDDEAGRAFSETKQRYKNLLVIEPLSVKAKSGSFSPTLLRDRVSKIYGREFVRGNVGRIGDLARIGNELLSDLGGSDTASKLGVLAAPLYVGSGAAGGIAGVLGNAATVGVGLAANRAAQSLINRNQGVVNASLNKARLKSSSKKPVKITIRPSDKTKK